jgi:hypothetical protein
MKLRYAAAALILAAAMGCNQMPTYTADPPPQWQSPSFDTQPDSATRGGTGMGSDH